jgi:hypothetical protein
MRQAKQTCDIWTMTFIWFIVWFISDRIGDRESLAFAPADWWAITLIGAVALDLGKHHTAHRAKN